MYIILFFHYKQLKIMYINTHKSFCFAPSHYVLHKDIAYVMT